MGRGGEGIFQFVSHCVKMDVDGNMKAQTQKAPYTKVRYIVTQMLHIAKALRRCIVYGYEGRTYPVGAPLVTPGGCTWNFGAATLRHKKAAVESGLVCLLMAWRPVDQWTRRILS